MTNFVNLAIKRPLVLDVKGSNRHVFGKYPALQGQFLAASISVSSVDWNKNAKTWAEQIS